MKPDGSTRRTRPSRGVAAAPLLDRARGRRGVTRTASVDSRSATTSRLSGSPISSSGSPTGTTDCALAQPLQHHAVDRRDDIDGPAAELEALQPRPRQLQLVLRPRDGELRGADALPRRVLQRRLRRFELVARDGAGFSSASSRRERRLRARRAPPRRGRARPAPGRRPRAAASTAAVQLGLASRIDERRCGGVSRATTVLPRTTGSPGSSSMRSQPARDRRRHDEPLAHARLALFVDRHLHRPRATLRQVDVDRARPERDGEDGATTIATTATRRRSSSKSRMRRSLPAPSAPPRDRACPAAGGRAAPETIAAPMMPRNDQATAWRET